MKNPQQKKTQLIEIIKMERNLTRKLFDGTQIATNPKTANNQIMRTVKTLQDRFGHERHCLPSEFT